MTRSDSLVTITIPTAISGISRAQNKLFYRSTRLTPHINLIDTGQVVMPSQALLDLIESGYPKTSKKGSKPPYPMTAMLLIHYETTIDA